MEEKQPSLLPAQSARFASGGSLPNINRTHLLSVLSYANQGCIYLIKNTDFFLYCEILLQLKTVSCFIMY